MTKHQDKELPIYKSVELTGSWNIVIYPYEFSSGLNLAGLAGTSKTALEVRTCNPGVYTPNSIRAR